MTTELIIEDKKCKYIFDDGERCNAYSLKEKDFCFSHDPGSKEQKALAVRAGGLSKQIKITGELEAIRVETPGDVIKLLGATICEVREGRLPTQIANTIGFLSGHLLRAFELSETEAKVEEVKAVLMMRRPTKRK
jgi:hypothetical protein